MCREQTKQVVSPSINLSALEKIKYLQMCRVYMCHTSLCDTYTENILYVGNEAESSGFINVYH